LHLCSEEGVIIINYTDDAQGTMIETLNGSGSFSQVTLYPTVTVKEKEMESKAMELHKKATKLCFIANSVNFPVNHIPTIVTI
ncbi:MAG: OsmC family peroxiredoxin, partial [Bacteroidia bacterium]|nr:OsmC family peroxiredoxin [Bacteroidia bacterium]